MKKQVVVIGLGRFGSNVVKSFYNLGHDVLAIDKNEERVQIIMGQASYALSGDATNEMVLRDLGIQNYDAAVVAIGSDLVASITTSVLLKTMGVRYVVARAHDELHSNTLELIGVDKIVQPESEMGVRLAHSLFNPNVEEYLEITPNYGISKMRVPKRFIAMSLDELGLANPRDKLGLSVVAVRRGNDITLNPDPSDRLQDGDWIVLVGGDELLYKLETEDDG